MAAASPWTHDQVTAAFRNNAELKSLLLTDVVDTGEKLGHGAFGVVSKLRAGATVCAGKRIHDMLVDPKDKGAKEIVVNFLKECKMLADLRHPNIVQFLGVCLLQGSKIPILVTELLTDSLHHYLETHRNLSMAVKQSFLTDIALALVFLHSRKPQIIHRDLTAKNVLVDERSMKVKVADLGNSRFTAASSASMTRQPGTPVYMPPEALEQNPNYCDKLDIFSFGHLSLFTLTQVFPWELLAPNAYSAKTKKLVPRTEMERRGKYMDILKKELPEEHHLVELVKMCLNNDPNKRPNAMQVLHRLEDTHPDYEDVIPSRQRMADILNQKDQEIVNLRQRLQQRESELELFSDSDVVIKGPLEKFCPKNIMRKWKSYTFKATNMHLRFFNSLVRGPRGEILLSAVNCVLIPHRSGRIGDKHCFEVHFRGRDSPWILSAFSVEERKNWMRAIRRQKPTLGEPLPAEGVAAKPLAPKGVHQPQQMGAVRGKQRHDPQVESNAAYGLVPLTTGIDRPDVPTPAEDEHYYESIQPLNPHLSPPPTPGKPKLPQWPPVLKRSPARAAAAEKDGKGDKSHRESRAPQKEPSATYQTTFDTLNRRANKFTPIQINHLITMLQQTQDAVGGGKGDDEKETVKEPHIRVDDRDSDLPPDSTYVKPYYVNYDKLLEPGDSQEKQATFPRQGTKSPYYVNFLDVYERGRPSSVKQHRESERRPRSASPTPRDSSLFTFSDMAEDPSQVKSHSHLDLRDTGAQEGRGRALKPSIPPKPSCAAPYLDPLPITHGKQRETLKNMLRQSKQAPESLLITEDDNPTEYVLRPQWAKANTNRPGPSTLAALHRSGLYISPKILSKFASLGEGRFGKVYKAEMMRKTGNKIKVALKSVDNITPDFQKEVNTMLGVVHPNIVRLYGLIDEGEIAPAMVMEYLPSGDLKTFLSRNSRDKPQLMKYMIDVAMGMHYLSDKGIIHRDLAARNILVDKNELCKVADFGLVREVPRESMFYVSRSRRPSPIRWMAPESISKRVFSPASDIWSFGILQWEMFNPNKPYPYPTFRNEEVVEKVTSGYPMATPRNAPRIVVRIMKACWNSEPSRRPSFLLIANLLTSHMIGDD